MSKIYQVPPDTGGRADVVLADLLGVSRAKSAKLLSSGQVVCHGVDLKKSDLVLPGDQLEVLTAAAGKGASYQVVGLPILYQDDQLIVVNKPPQMAAHPSASWHGPTVVQELQSAGCPLAPSDPQRPGIVHRLDAGTSGAMVVAKTKDSFSALVRAFQTHQVVKIYHAIVRGSLNPGAGTISAPVGRHPTRKLRMSIVEGGKPAITHYRTLDQCGDFSLLELRLETGRTHQIRVHLEGIGHPVFADPLYGVGKHRLAQGEGQHLGLDRQWLHAYDLGFSHPLTGASLRFVADYPADLPSLQQVAQTNK